MNERFARDARAHAIALVALAVLGLATMGLLPWATLTVQAGEGDEFLTCFLDRGAFAGVVETPCGTLSLAALGQHLTLIEAGLWAVLALGLVALAGAVRYRQGPRPRRAAGLILLGTGHLMGASLALLGLVLFIGGLEGATASLPPGAEPSMLFGYNYAPAVAVVLMLVVGVAYAARLTAFAFVEAAGGTLDVPATPWGREPPLVCAYCGTPVALSGAECVGCGLALRPDGRSAP